jgi:hypothetical protein
LSTRLTPLAPGEELSDPESFLWTHSIVAGPNGWRPVPIATPVVTPEPPPPAAARVQVLELEGCRTRCEVEQVVIRRARAHASAAALLLVRRGGIHAVCCDPQPPRTPGPIYWTTRPLALAAVLERRRIWRGPPPKDPLTRRILLSLGRSDAQEIAFFPISVHERLVAILYADAAADPLLPASMVALEDLCQRVSLAWVRMLIAGGRDGAR